LAWVAGSTNKSSSTSIANPAELPIEGDATANMGTVAPSTKPTGRKPWWWWPTLMPLWVRIATSGSEGMNDRLSAFDSQHGPADHPEHSSGKEVIGPCKRDYLFSIFFIFFGVVAMVAGVFSNVYVQINNIFYTPT
jgi:hypothetical protein